jgi:predicted dithiol-disulfide oxidoreductase (DUF899 family)
MPRAGRTRSGPASAAPSGADQVAHPGLLHARNTTLAFASRAPQAEIRRLKERHGWNHIPWYTITDDFDKDFDVDEWHGTNAFIREGDQVFRTYFIDINAPVVELPRRAPCGRVIACHARCRANAPQPGSTRRVS